MEDLMVDMLEARALWMSFWMPSWNTTWPSWRMCSNVILMESPLAMIGVSKMGYCLDRVYGVVSSSPGLRNYTIRPKNAGKAVFIHSCGKVQSLFPELIELGLDVFNPFQPEVMDPYEIKKQYGSQLCFYGGVSVQKLLPYGTPGEIRTEVKRLMEEVGRGGGFIVAPSHDMPGDIPLENLLAFIDTVRAQE